jgi:hypothetical protein
MKKGILLILICAFGLTLTSNKKEEQINEPDGVAKAKCSRLISIKDGETLEFAAREWRKAHEDSCWWNDLYFAASEDFYSEPSFLLRALENEDGQANGLMQGCYDDLLKAFRYVDLVFHSPLDKLDVNYHFVRLDGVGEYTLSTYSWHNSSNYNYLKAIFNNEKTRNWLMDKMLNAYQIISSQVPKDSKIEMIQLLSECITFIDTYDQKKSYYDKLASHPKGEPYEYGNPYYYMRNDIGIHRAFLYRRIALDGLDKKILRSCLVKCKEALSGSLQNSKYSHKNEWIVNNELTLIPYIYSKSYKKQISIVRSRFSGKELKFTCAKCNIRHVVGGVKCLKEDGKNYYVFSDNSGHKLVVDDALNAIANDFRRNSYGAFVVE